MLRLLLIGDVGGPETYHVGDEAMLAANLDELSAFVPIDSSVTVVSADPQSTSSRYGVAAVRRLGFPSEGDRDLVERVVEDARRSAPELPAIAALAASDALLVSGGGNLNSTWPGHVHERVALMRSAAWLDKPSFVVGQTLGPVLFDVHRAVLSETLPAASFVGVRELDSFLLALRLGVPAQRLHYQLDDAFFLQEKAPEAVELPDSPWIAVTLAGSSQPLVDAVLPALTALQQSLRCPLVFVPHAAHPDDDARLGQDLSKRLDGHLTLLPLLEAREAAWVTRRASMVISSRYHPLVFGLSGEVPCLALYSDDYTRVKLRGALRHGGLEDWCLDLRSLTAPMLTDAAEEMWERREEISRHLAGRRAVWQALHRHHWRMLAQSLGLDATKPDNGSPPAKVERTSPRPNGPWAKVAARQAVTGDETMWREIDLHEQRDSARRYALSLKEILAAREEELANLKTLLAQREDELAALRDLAAAERSDDATETGSAGRTEETEPDSREPT